jgi:gluconokinase
MIISIVIMGVAGCGKSSCAAALAQLEGLPLVEGDEHHSAASLDKMSRGIALTDDDRAGWLDRLVQQIRLHPQGLVLTCSALKRSYREQLRGARPGLRFVFLEIGRGAALQRVQSRAGAHFFSAALVDSQFATLEPPHGEPGVLALDALRPVPELARHVHHWLQEEPTA